MGSQVHVNNSRVSDFVDISFSHLQTPIVALVDQKGAVVSTNDHFLQAFNYTLDDLKTLNMNKMVMNEPRLLERIKANIKRNYFWGGYICLKNKHHQVIESVVNVIPYQSDSACYLFLISPLNQIREWAKLKNLAYTDELTDLPNLRKFQESLVKQIERSKFHNSKFALLFIDIDDFKQINDQYGHLIGDKLLQECASRLVQTVQYEGDIFRKSGDEFLIIMNEIHRVEKVVHSIQKQFKKRICIDNSFFKVRLSVGVSIYPDHGQSPDSLIHFADKEMYGDKTRNKFWS